MNPGKLDPKPTDVKAAANDELELVIAAHSEAWAALQGGLIELRNLYQQGPIRDRGHYLIVRNTCDDLAQAYLMTLEDLMRVTSELLRWRKTPS